MIGSGHSLRHRVVIGKERKALPGERLKADTKVKSVYLLHFMSWEMCTRLRGAQTQFVLRGCPKDESANDAIRNLVDRFLVSIHLPERLTTVVEMRHQPDNSPPVSETVIVRLVLPPTSPKELTAGLDAVGLNPKHKGPTVWTFRGMLQTQESKVHTVQRTGRRAGKTATLKMATRR
jgi:hypothetical protein